MDRLGMVNAADRDNRPLRLVGDLSQFTLAKIIRDWPVGIPRQGEDRLWHWTRILWTEVRAAVLHSIWTARCSLLAGDKITTREEAAQHAEMLVSQLLRSLIYRKVPSLLLLGTLQPASAPRRLFYNLTWGTLAPIYLQPQHRRAARMDVPVNSNDQDE